MLSVLVVLLNYVFVIRSEDFVAPVAIPEALLVLHVDRLQPFLELRSVGLHQLVPPHILEMSFLVARHVYVVLEASPHSTQGVLHVAQD